MERDTKNNQCKNCIFYNEAEDNLRMQYNDIVDVDTHYCIIFKKGIIAEIWNDLKACQEKVQDD